MGWWAVTESSRLALTEARVVLGKEVSWNFFWHWQLRSRCSLTAETSFRNMRHLNVARHNAVVTEALAVLTAVTTTQAGVGRRNSVANLLRELEDSFELGDPRLPLRWVAIEYERENPRDIANLIFASAHALARRVLREEPAKLDDALQHFAKVRAHVEHALSSPEFLEGIMAIERAYAVVDLMPPAANLLEHSVPEPYFAETA